MIGLILFICLVGAAVISMIVISLKVESSLRKQNYISGVKYGVVVQQLQDKHELHRFGFAQYFKRQYGELSIFSISMNAIGIFPMLLLLAEPILSNGGLSTSLFVYSGIGIVGLIIVTLIAQYLSSQPTAGGLYHVALRKYGTWLGSLVGGFQFITQLALLIGYSYGFVYFVTILLPEETRHLQQSVPLYIAVAVVVLLQGIMSSMRSSFYRLLHNVGMLLQMLGIAVLFYIIIRLLQGDVYSGLHMFYNDLSVTGWFPSRGELQASHVGVMIALVCRLFIGGDASSQVAEETIEPKVRVSWATLLSTCYSYIIGLILLLLMAIVYMNYGMSSAAATSSAWLMTFLNEAGALGISVIILALIGCFMSGTTMIQVGARTLMAMARDGIFPLKTKIAQFSYSKQIPQYAMFGTQIAALALLSIMYVTGVKDLVLVTSLVTVIFYALQLIVVFYFVQIDSHKAIWRLEEWGRPLRYLSMMMLVAVATVAGTMLTVSQWALLLVPIIVLVVYATLKNGLATRLLNYDASGTKDLFEVEGKVPL